MRVLIIGAGNVATVFGRLMKAAGHEIIQVVSRNMESAKILGNELGCPASAGFADIDKTADVYLAAMSDAALNEIKENIQIGNRVIVHTAGAVSKDILKTVSGNYGVMYPLQSLNKDRMDIDIQIPLLIDSSNEYSEKVIYELAHSISPMVKTTNDEQRLKLHVAAVITNNFTNHLYTLTYNYCKAESLDFEMLLPLIEETAHRLRKYLPATMQTGPAKRKDTPTLDKHLRILNNHPDLKKIYLKMTDSIMNN